VADGPLTLIGRYELHRALASGGMATVHLGRLRSATGLARTVALKRMHPHFATDPEFVAMFFDEARLAMRLQHPNVVPTFDVVSDDDELLLVMEYIHGESLSGLLRAAAAAGERVPPAVASSIVCGVLAGLHAAHEAKSEDGAPLEIVHRDVSPQNVMVGVDGVARLLDFGIAKAAGRVHSTADGQVKGKFAYMAPEQLTNGEVDRRVDVFAAAVVLWETLTGDRLFRGDTPGALVHAVLTAEIAAPSAIIPALPAAVDAVVLRGLARQRRERFATARDMAVALEGSLPPATARAVGEWVEAHAGPTLDRRASLLKDVESASGPRGGEPSAQAPDALSGQNEVPTASLVHEDVSVAGVGTGTGPKRGARKRAWVFGATAAAIAVPLGVVVTMAAVRKVSGGEPAGAAASALASKATATGAAALASAAPSSSASLLASAAAPAPAPASASASHPAPSPLHRHSRPHRAAGKPDCSNPFVVDARGIRVPRPECF